MLKNGISFRSITVCKELTISRKKPTPQQKLIKKNRADLKSLLKLLYRDPNPEC